MTPSWKMNVVERRWRRWFPPWSCLARSDTVWRAFTSLLVITYSHTSLGSPFICDVIGAALAEVRHTEILVLGD
jgi:hypothetical protein